MTVPTHCWFSQGNHLDAWTRLINAYCHTHIQTEKIILITEINTNNVFNWKLGKGHLENGKELKIRGYIRRRGLKCRFSHTWPYPAIALTHIISQWGCMHFVSKCWQIIEDISVAINKRMLIKHFSKSPWSSQIWWKNVFHPSYKLKAYSTWVFYSNILPPLKILVSNRKHPCIFRPSLAILAISPPLYWGRDFTIHIHNFSDFRLYSSLNLTREYKHFTGELV